MDVNGAEKLGDWGVAGEAMRLIIVDHRGPTDVLAQEDALLTSPPERTYRSQACIGGEKRLDSVQPSNCMGSGSGMRASVLLSLTGKDGNDGNLHREDDFRFHTSVQRWTDDIP